MPVDGLRAYFPLLTLIALVGAVGAMDPTFLRPVSLLQLAAVSTLFVMALGITFTIYIGSIDLSAVGGQHDDRARVGGDSATWLHRAAAGSGGRLHLWRGVRPGGRAGQDTDIHRHSGDRRRRLLHCAIRLRTKGAFHRWGAEGKPAGLDVRRSRRMPKELVVACALLAVALFVERRTVLGRVFKAIGAGEWARSLPASGRPLQDRRLRHLRYAGGHVRPDACGASLGGIFGDCVDHFLLPAIVAVLVGGTPLTGGVRRGPQYFDWRPDRRRRPREHGLSRNPRARGSKSSSVSFSSSRSR